jgi:hypothetical protein
MESPDEQRIFRGRNRPGGAEKCERAGSEPASVVMKRPYSRHAEWRE